MSEGEDISQPNSIVTFNMRRPLENPCIMINAKINMKSGRGNNEKFYGAQARHELLLQETPYYKS